MFPQAAPAIAEASINQGEASELADIDFLPAPAGLAPYIGASRFVEAPAAKPIENTIW